MNDLFKLRVPGRRAGSRAGSETPARDQDATRHESGPTIGAMPTNLDIRPLTPERIQDLAALFEQGRDPN